MSQLVIFYLPLVPNFFSVNSDKASILSSSKVCIPYSSILLILSSNGIPSATQSAYIRPNLAS